MKTATDPRHLLRKKLIQELFAASFNQNPSKSIRHIWNTLSQIDPLIAESAPEWPVNKLNPIDLAILRLGFYELTIDKKAPYKVIIDECIELAKEFGSDSSPGFINGAIGHYISKHEQSHQ